MEFIDFAFRYIFKNEKKVGLQELGPRFTLKLRWLQKGAFDTKYGEYEWIHKVSWELIIIIIVVFMIGLQDHSLGI